MNRRQWRRRVLDDLCLRHNTPLTPSHLFDGATCEHGCRALNVVREKWKSEIREERLVWPPQRPPDPLTAVLAELRSVIDRLREQQS